MRYMRSGPASDANEVLPRTFEEYVRRNRFKSTETLSRIEKEFTACRSQKPYLSRIVVIHAPYPSDGEISGDLEAQELSAGQGCGKSDLLVLVQEQLSGREDCRVITFLNNRDRIGEGISFYKDVFLEELATLDKTLIAPFKYRFSRMARVALSLLLKISIFFSIGLPGLIGVGVYNLFLIVWKVIELILDPKNIPILERLAIFFEQNQAVLFGIGLAGLLVWILYALGTLQRNEELKQQWKAIGQRYSEAEALSQVKEQLANNPKEILRRFAKYNCPLVLLVDDVDVLDGFSFQALLGLYEEAMRSQKWPLWLVLTYNPRNPTLYVTERSAIRQWLDLMTIREKGWASIQLEPPTHEHVRTWLWGYYRHPRAAELAGVLEQAYPEAHSNPSLLLSFFVAFDRQLKGASSIASVSDEHVKQEFERYLNRDRRLAQDIIDAIQRSELAEGCLEMLKCILAFKRLQIRVEYVRALMSHTSDKDFESYERVLLSDQVNLLRKTYIDNYPTYVFRYPYLRSVLDTGWKQWRESAPSYYTKAFLELHKRGKDVPELALEAAPSRLAIDVLYREGEYYYNYYGNSDAGYALRFYGVERGGALSKWLKLCEDAIVNQENLWDFIYWKSDARNNPYRYLGTTRQYPAWTFAPDLVLMAGRLYWMNGQWKTVLDIWTRDWPQIRDHLPPAPKPELAKRLQEVDGEIQASLAEMLYAVGQPDGWHQANELCQMLRQRLSNESRAWWKAHLISALIKHYQTVGIGNELPPYKFLRPDVNLATLKSLCEVIPETEMDYLRPLHIIAESLWQILVPFSLLPLDIDLSKIQPLEIDSGIFDQFVQVLDEEQRVLESIRKHYESRERAPFAGKRITRGDLFFWEGVFLFMRARHFRLLALREFGRYHRIFKDKKRSEIRQRFETYYAVANLLNNLCLTRVRKVPAQFADYMYQLEEIERGWPDGQTDAMEKAERKAREITEQLYRAGWEGIIGQSDECLQMAEAIYRRLGYQQGIAAVAFIRALIAYEFSESAAFGERPLWLDEFERFFRWSSGELGYHLDALRGHLKVALWACRCHPYRAVKEFQAVDIWVSPERLGLPKALSGELNYQIGNLIGSMESAPFSEEYTLEVFERAAKVIDGLGDKLPYISPDTLVDRRLTIHWWLAELSRRRAQKELDPAERERYFQRVIQECNYIINQTKGRKERAMVENMARLVRGEARVGTGEAKEGFEEVERALSYFQKEGNLFWVLQALTYLVHWGIWSPPDHKCWERSISQHLPALVRAASDYRSAMRNLGYVERLVLHRAAHLLGKVYSLSARQAEDMEERRSRYFSALEWLNTTFDILISLNLCGAAILLDNELRPVYEALGDTFGMEKHRRRIIAAAQKLDPGEEKIPFALISPILRRYYIGAVFAESQHITEKRECLQAARRALRHDEPETGPAIELLERACRLIDRHNPEDIDAEILETLTIACYRHGNPIRAREAREELTWIQSVIQSRDFLAIAERCKADGEDCRWALVIAASASPPNEYSLRAQAALRLEEIPVEMSEPPREERGEIPYDELLNKPISEFDAADCYQLLRWLERELRRLIAEELSKLTPNWWKERVPYDTRVNAETRKQARETPYPGRARQDLSLVEYLDFSDYVKIITMKTNWDEAFKRIFGRQDVVSVKLGEIKPYRDDVAHMRALSPQDREVFVTNARQLLRAILEASSSTTTSGPPAADES